MDQNNNTDNKTINTESQNVDQTPPETTNTSLDAPVSENKEGENASIGSPVEKTSAEGTSPESVSSEPSASVTAEPSKEDSSTDSNSSVNTSSESTQSSLEKNSTPMQQKNSKKGLFIAVIVVIILILVSVAGYMAIMMKSTLNTAKTTQPQAVITPVVTSPTPSTTVSTNAPLDEQAQGVDVGSIDQGMQSLQNDLNQL